MCSGGPFPGAESLVIGSTVNVQFMVKDSQKVRRDGGLGFADFKNGNAGDRAMHETCFALSRACERSRLRFHPLCTLVYDGKYRIGLLGGNTS